jgi:hypothetical protein
MAVKLRTDRKQKFDEHMLPQRNQEVSAGRSSCVRTNAIPLDTFIDPDSLRSHREWNWRTGETQTVSACVLENAKRHINKLQVRTVTSNRTHPDPQVDYGYGALQAPATVKVKANRRKSR